MKPSVALKLIKKKRDNSIGICSNFQLVYEGSFIYLTDAMRAYKIDWSNWKEYSGTLLYPVPHPTMKPHIAYDLCNNYFSWFNRYGRARRRLLNWLIKEFEKKGA